MIPKRELGRTGLSVTLFSLGGEGALEKPNCPDEAENIINRAIDLGVNYLDTAPTYGSGQSEKNIGRVMKSRRSEVYLATKTLDRTYDGTMKLLENSLGNLQTDYLDLYQVHNVRTNEDLDKAFGKDGAVKALEKLRDEGVIRFLGLTGHSNSGILLRGIREYPFDTLLMTLNAGDIHYDPFQEKLLKEAVKMEMGIIAMKVTATGRIFRKDGLTSMKQALGYVLSFPVSNAIISISEVDEVDENTRVAANFEPLGSVELKEFEELVKPNKEEANYFKIHW